MQVHHHHPREGMATRADPRSPSGERHGKTQANPVARARRPGATKRRGHYNEDSEEDSEQRREEQEFQEALAQMMEGGSTGMPMFVGNDPASIVRLGSGHDPG